jgi:hypothetical protein
VNKGSNGISSNLNTNGSLIWQIFLVSILFDAFIVQSAVHYNTPKNAWVGEIYGIYSDMKVA